MAALYLVVQIVGDRAVPSLKSSSAIVCMCVCVRRPIVQMRLFRIYYVDGIKCPVHYCV